MSSTQATGPCGSPSCELATTCADAIHSRLCRLSTVSTTCVSVMNGTPRAAAARMSGLVKAMFDSTASAQPSSMSSNTGTG
ncbi:hypothetical protein [Actinokineospora cianjurensis]|uniref:hypothetical protein n=1 Tax=Actinokineospora cianjurensis TaxID=585224 RepID=UPI003CCC69BD